MTKRFEAHIHCGDGGEHYHDGIIDNLDKSKRIIKNYHSISVIMNNLWEQTQRFEKHNQKLEKVYDSLIDENKQLKKENKVLKALLDEMSDCNDEIWLYDGRIYRLRKVFEGKWRRVDG